MSRYNINGWMEDLDDLNGRFGHGRHNHGCTQFTNNDGDKVRSEDGVCHDQTGIIYCLFRLILCAED